MHRCSPSKCFTVTQHQNDVSVIFLFCLGTFKLLADMNVFLFRYYSALKTMEQLENIYIPRVSQYRFCQIMAETLPKLREEIKEISMSDLKDFLESIRKHSDKIGETAMRQVGFSFYFIKIGCCKSRFLNLV